jgi:hypothetical protein
MTIAFQLTGCTQYPAFPLSTRRRSIPITPGGLIAPGCHRANLAGMAHRELRVFAARDGNGIYTVSCMKRYAIDAVWLGSRVVVTPPGRRGRLSSMSR